MSKIKDLAGQRFGKLVALTIAPKNKHGCYQWDCRCDCGTTLRRSGSTLRRALRAGDIVSCGCAMGDKLALPHGQASANQILAGYRIAASRRNRTFNLTNEEFFALTKQNCHYCGSPPSQIRGRARNRGYYVYSGIDRIDNMRGYELDNVRPCCVACNRAKTDRTEAEFYNWLSRVCRHLELV